MDTNQFFSWPRFGHLLYREFEQNKKNLGLIAFSIIGFLLTAALYWAYERDEAFHETYYPSVLFLIGLIGTSLSFTEMNKPDSKLFFLTLPASSFEKFLGRWLASGIGFALLFTLAYWAFSLVANGLAKGIFQHDLGIFNPFSAQNTLFLQVYLAVQSIFLLGAIYFRKAAIFKTVLSTLLFILLLVTISILLFRIVMFDLFDGLFHLQPEMEIDGKITAVEPSPKKLAFFKNNGETYARLLGLWITPFILLIVGYFKLKETEL